jgi:tetratricopeptide (TPR) repeat protein
MRMIYLCSSQLDSHSNSDLWIIATIAVVAGIALGHFGCVSKVLALMGGSSKDEDNSKASLSFDSILDDPFLESFNLACQKGTYPKVVEPLLDKLWTHFVNEDSNDPHAIELRRYLSRAFAEVGALEKAVYAVRSVDLSKDRAKDDLKGLVSDLAFLAYMYPRMDSHEPAEEILLMILDLINKASKGQQERVVDTALEISEFYIAEGHRDKAVTLVEKLLKICKSNFGLDHATTVKTAKAMKQLRGEES